jgi:predicted PurR-regulated permease PerM
MQDNITQQRNVSLLTLLNRAMLLIGLVALALIIRSVAQILLLAFAAVLLAILLRSLSGILHHYTRIPEKPSLALVIIGLIALIGLGGWLLIPSVADQLNALLELIPNSVAQIRQAISRVPLGARIMEWVPQDVSLLPDGTSIARRIGGIFSTTIGILGSLMILIFLGIYMAIEPQTYVNGIVKLVPPDRRDRAHEVFSALGTTLRRWLLAKIAAMVVIGTLTTIGLWLLGMPLALALGVIAALLSFIPNIGPVLAEIPAVLIAFNQEGPLMPLWVLLLYLGIQAVESYLLLPMLLRESIELPPVMVLLAVMILGSFFGILGIFVAAPLMASVMVLVKMLYIEDTLGDNKKEDTSGESSSAQQDDTQSGAAQKQPPSDGKQAQRASQSK